MDRFNPTYDYSDTKSLSVYGVSLGDSYEKPVITSGQSNVTTRGIDPDQDYGFKEYASVKLQDLLYLISIKITTFTILNIDRRRLI